MDLRLAVSQSHKRLLLIYANHDNRTKNLGLVAFAMTLAMVLGPLLGGILSDPHIISWFNNTTPFMLAFGLSIFNLWLLQRYVQETHQVNQQDHIGWRNILRTLTQISRAGNIRIILCAFFCYEFGWSLYFQSSPLWLIQQYHLSVTELAFFLSAIGIWMSLGLTVILAKLVRHFSATKLFIYALALASASVFAMCILPMRSTQWVAIIPLAIATGIAYPCMLTELSNQTPHVKQGGIMGIASAFLSGSWLVSGVLASLLYNLPPTVTNTIKLYRLCNGCMYFYGVVQKTSLTLINWRLIRRSLSSQLTHNTEPAMILFF